MKLDRLIESIQQLLASQGATDSSALSQAEDLVAEICRGLACEQFWIRKDSEQHPDLVEAIQVALQEAAPEWPDLLDPLCAVLTDTLGGEIVYFPDPDLTAGRAERDQAIAQMAKKGKRVNEIAQAHELSPRRVCQILQEQRLAGNKGRFPAPQNSMAAEREMAS